MESVLLLALRTFALVAVVMLMAPLQLARGQAGGSAAPAASAALGVALPARPAARTEPRFDILAFSVSGNTVLSADEIERAVYPFLGESKTIADAEHARAALERAYQVRGYLSVAVQLPPQTAANQELTLAVVETQIGQRRITGAAYNLPSVIAAETPSLTPGRVPDFNELQADLARVQAKVDLQVTPVLAASPEANKLDVELKVADQLPLHGSIEVNNKQTFNTDAGKIEAGLRYDNLFQRQHSFGVNWLLPMQGAQRGATWVFSHGVPLGDGRLSSTLVTSNSKTPTSLGGATVTQGETLGSRYRQPLGGAEPGFGHGWTAGADFKNNRDGNQSVAGVSTQNPDLRYLVLTAAYDLFSSLSAGQQTTFDLSLAAGLGGFGGRTVDCNGQVLDQFACKRAGASSRFQVLRMNLSHRQAVFGRWDASLRAQLQLAADPLASSEQIGAGGVDSARGYYEFEQIGDQGLVLRAELASPAITTWGSLAVSGLIFGDLARLRVNQALAAEQANIRMGSVGLGLRAQAADGLQVRLDYALPLIATLKADSNGQLVPASGRDTPNSGRVDLSARYAF